MKRRLKELIRRNRIEQGTVENMYFFADEHSTSTNGFYELRESLEEEFKRGMFARDYSRFFPPLFPEVQTVSLEFCNSASVILVRAADIIANRIYHDAISGKCQNNFDDDSNKLLLQDFRRKKTNSVYIAHAVHRCTGFFYLRQKCCINASLMLPSCVP